MVFTCVYCEVIQYFAPNVNKIAVFACRKLLLQSP